VLRQKAKARAAPENKIKRQKQKQLFIRFLSSY
jgi:hypothetical protein